MFGWFRKKSKEPNARPQVEAATKVCVEVFTRTWRDLDPKAETPDELAYEIEKFSSDAFRFMFEKFPITKHAPPFSLWMIIFTAVQGAKTHPQTQLNEAIAMLRERYAD